MAVTFEIKQKPDVGFEIEGVRVIKVGTGDGTPYKIGYGLKVEDNTLMVDAADAVEQDNTKPVTSAAVFTEVGNINALLATI